MNKPLLSAGLKHTALVVALLSISGCASLQDTRAPTSTPTATAGVSNQAAPPVIVDTSADAEAAAAAERAAAIADINRDGRTIQLGRFVEETPAVPQLTNDVVQLNYEQEDLRTVFEQLGNVLNLNMVIDPTINSRVSMRTAPNNPLRAADIWPVMRQLARNAGVTIEQVGNVWEFTLNPSNIPAEILLPGELGDATSSEILQVTPLTYISIEAVETIINPLLQPAGSLIRLGPGNLLGIYGSPEQLARINALLSVLDDDPFQNQGIQLYPLVNSSAAAVAEELKSVLTLIEGEQSAYQVLGLERINAVLVTAPAGRGFNEVNRWMRILDAESQEQGEQLFVYRVKNLTATTLGETLVSVFGEEDDTEEDAPQQDITTVQGPTITRLTPDGQQVPIPGPFGGFSVTTEPAAGAEDIVSGNLSVTIVADEDTNSLLVRASPREYRQLLTTIAQLDTVPLQVLINAVIGQVTLTDAMQFGIDWTRISANSRLGLRVLPATPFENGQQVAGSGLVLERSFLDGAATIDAMLSAIGQDNKVSLLARPTLLAMNNQEGNFIVGEKVPVNNGVTLSGTGQQTENISYQDVGIVLTITPRINADGFITLTIAQELSSVRQSSGGVADNPTFATQEINTTVVVADQETITLGGLIQDDSQNNSSGVPYLQSIPVLGGLFAYKDLKKERKELFIIIRPQIIRGDGRDNAQIQAFRESFTNVSNLLREYGL